MRSMLLVFVTLFIATATAQGSPLDMYGFTSRATAMGNAMIAATDDVSAVHYNLAAMTRVRKASGFAFNMVIDDVSIKLQERPAGIDPPRYDQRLNPRSNTDDINDNQGVSIGFIHNLWTQRLRFGVGVYIPTNAIQSQMTHFNDETEQYFSNRLHFELIGERTRKQVINFGLAYEVMKNFSAGVGVSMFLDSSTNAFTYQENPLAFADIKINLQNEQIHTFNGIAGLHWHGESGWNIGATYKEAVDFPLTGGNIVQIGGLAEGEAAITQEIDILVQYTPEQYGLGVSYDGLDRWNVGLDVVYKMWSKYRDNHNQPADPELDDIFSPRFGLEYVWSERFKVRFGYLFAPTPIPKTVGRVNYVDNDRHVLSFGIGYQGKIKDVPFTVDWHVQVHLLTERTVNKDLTAEDPVLDEDPNTPGLQTGNPGYPGWSSNGHLVNTGITITFESDLLPDSNGDEEV